MATKCSSCGCNNLTCGCKNSYLTTPPPCPTPVDCPETQPCSEVFPAECIIYTGDDIGCTVSSNPRLPGSPTVSQTVVTQNSSVGQALQDIVNYFCSLASLIPITVVEAGDNVEVTSDTVNNITTYTVNALETIVVAGANVTVVPVTVGNTTTYTVSATGGGGLPPWQFVGVALLGAYQTVLIANSRIVYNVSANNFAEFTTPPTPSIGTEIEILYRGNVPFYIKPGILASNTSVQIWRDPGYLTATSAGPTRLEWAASVSEVYNVRIKLLCVQNSGGGIVWVIIEQTWNDQLISVVP
jgi:hypothetical protein